MAVIYSGGLPPFLLSPPFNRGRIYPRGKTSLGTIFFWKASAYFLHFATQDGDGHGVFFIIFFYPCIPTTSPGKGPLSHTQD